MRPPSSRARNVTSHSVFGSKNAVDRRFSSRRLSAQNEISLFFPQGNSESRYKERQTRFFRRIPHFPRSRGARAPGCDSFWTKVFGWTKVILFNLKYVTTFVDSCLRISTFVRKYFRKYKVLFESTFVLFYSRLHVSV